MKTIIRLVLTAALLFGSGLALAGGGGKSAPPPPPPPPAPPIPATQKAPEPEVARRRNRQAGMEGVSGTMLTGNDPTEQEAGLTLGGNTLLGS